MKDQHNQTIKRCIRHASEYGAPSRAVECNGLYRICQNCPEVEENMRKTQVPWFLREQAS